MYIRLINCANGNTEYEFKADEDGVDCARIFVSHRNDQTDITIEICPESGIPNTADERTEFLMVHCIEIGRAIRNAFKD
jgi:hypothetical protein